MATKAKSSKSSWEKNSFLVASKAFCAEAIAARKSKGYNKDSWKKKYLKTFTYTSKDGETTSYVLDIIIGKNNNLTIGTKKPENVENSALLEQWLDFEGSPDAFFKEEGQRQRESWFGKLDMTVVVIATAVTGLAAFLYKR